MAVSKAAIASIVVAVVAVIVIVITVVLSTHSKRKKRQAETDEGQPREGNAEIQIEGETNSNTTMTLEDFLQNEVSDTEPISCCALKRFYDRLQPYYTTWNLDEDKITKAIKKRISNWGYGRQFELYKLSKSFRAAGFQCPDSCPEA